MSDKPIFNKAAILNCLTEQYGIRALNILALTGGADQNALVYQVITKDISYFLKLRKANIEDTPLLIQQFLKRNGLSEILAPIESLDHSASVNFEQYNFTLYPFIEGKSNAEKPMSSQNWVDFGKVLKQIHNSNLPQSLQSRLRLETYSSQYPKEIIIHLERIRGKSYVDPIAMKTAHFLRIKHDEIIALVDKTNKLRDIVQAQSLPLVLCHGDIHAGNRFVSKSGNFKIIDFDEPTLAPKERDLMYLGSGIIVTDTPREIELFYQGYELTETNNTAIAYFRCRRIIEDIVLYSDIIFAENANSVDNKNNFEYLTNNFLNGGVLEIANQTKV